MVSSSTFGQAGIRIPNKRPGVYEARIRDSAELLTIGRSNNLRSRTRQGLLKGKSPHSAGKDIRVHEDTSLVEVRWAETSRPAAVEEELHGHHRAAHGYLPKYTDR